jgi:hypothetical protein
LQPPSVQEFPPGGQEGLKPHNGIRFFHDREPDYEI